MIQGIPYFGEKTQEIYEFIQSNRYDEAAIAEVSYDSLYELIISNIDNNLVVIIDNKWLSWLNDIKFNYRDKEVYVPYYEYKTFKTPKDTYKSNNSGHLILNNGHIDIRYDYKYKKFKLDINKLSLKCLDVNTLEIKVLTTSKWISDNEFKTDKLYNLYINSSYKDDDYLVNKHAGGYHYIDRENLMFRNREKQLRKEYGFRDYDYSDNIKYDSDYRDVRQYKYDEVIKEFGFIENDKLYRIRRLEFEVYLYCCLRHGDLDNLKFKHHIYKLGDSIKLIIKDYWLDNISKPVKTYIK